MTTQPQPQQATDVSLVIQNNKLSQQTIVVKEKKNG